MRYFLAIIITSNVVLLFYTTLEVYTKFRMVSLNLRKIQYALLRLLTYLLAIFLPKEKWAIVQ